MAQILLVDDEKVARALYGDFLIGAGHEVTAVSSSEQAKHALGTQPFDLLVTDLLLPQSDGMALLQYAKATQPGIEALVITALDKVEPAVRAIKAGATDYLVKPVAPEVLAHAVNRALAQRFLLRENAELRRHVALLEAGQRVAMTLDREKLLESAGAAFTSSCAAQASVVFLKEETGLEWAGAHGQITAVTEDHKTKLLDLVESSLRQIDRGGQELELKALPFETSYLLPVFDQDTLLGAVLLLYLQDISEAGVAAAPFLIRHLALALRNIGRFAEVEDLVYLDDLTHLFNSRYLELVLDREFRTAEKEAKPFALLFLDLDYFKSINDTHGHVVGSKLLVEVSKILKACVRDQDVVCRWGGDEYVILLRATDSGGALKVAERIRRSIENHRFLAREGYSLSITTCIGVACYPEHGMEKETLIDFADRAMYRGKKGTRNIIYIASKNLEATPAARHQSDGAVPEASRAP